MKINQFRNLIIFLYLLLSILSSCDTLTYLRKGRNHLYLNDGTHELFWFNGIHSNDPKNIMFADLEKKFINFNPDFVLVEGGRDKNIKQNRNDAILHGESSFVAYLANMNKIECSSIEPSDSYIGEKLLLKYKMEDIIAMIAIRQINQWQRESKNRSIDFINMLIGFIRASSERLFININLEINLKFIQDITEPHIGFRINNDNWLSVPAFKIIHDDKNIINSILSETITIRNIYLIELIQEKRKKYNKIFIMMGFDHAKATMDELKTIYIK